MASEIRDARNRRWDEPFGEKALDKETVARILALPTFADVRAEDFPPRLPLDDIIANDGRIQRFARGETIIRKGDYGNSLFVVLEGAVIGVSTPTDRGRGTRGSSSRRPSWLRSIGRLLTRRTPPEYRPRRRARATEQLKARTRESGGGVREDIDTLASRFPTFTLGAPEMFGELAALTRSPRTASIYAAEDDTLLFELRWQGMREIRDWSMPFRQQIDRLYHERGLVTRLQECPIFRHVEAAALDEIASEALFETYGSFDWTHRFQSTIGKQGADQVIGQEEEICVQGNHVDGLLLIHNGFARVTQGIDHGERTTRQLSRNDTFGLEEIAADDGSDEAGPVLRSSLHAIGYVDVIRIPTHLVRKHVLPGLPPELRPRTEAADGERAISQGMMDFFVDRRFINGEAAMVINLDRCVGCDDCVRACASGHNNNPRFARHGNTYENVMVVNACMHCTDPVCLIGCPTGAIHREEDTGTVIINDATCIGCATCANSCPYNNIRMVDIRDWLGNFVLDNDGQAIARATKCDLCYDQLTGPACAQACPHDALTRINIRDTEKLAKWLG